MKKLVVPAAFAVLMLASANSKANPVIKANHKTAVVFRAKHIGNKSVSGEWHAEAKKTGYNIRFDHDEDKANWSSSSSFNLSEVKKINTNYQYTIVRDAGQLLMTGVLDGSKGEGKYIFIPDAGFAKKLTGDGMDDLTLKNEFTFFLLNIKQNYVAEMAKRGYPIKSPADLITFSANKINPEYIDMLAGFGYRNLKNHELISARSSRIDSVYLSTVGKDKLQNMTIMDLITLRAQQRP